jgi:hypothetical protein
MKRSMLKVVKIVQLIDDSMIEEEEIEKQLDDDRYDEYVYDEDDGNLCTYAFFMLNA